MRSILDNVLPEELFREIQDYALDLYKSEQIKPTILSRVGSRIGRILVPPNELLIRASECLLPVAKEVFGVPNLQTTKPGMGIYYGERASLPNHLDDDAADYSIDMTIIKGTDGGWPITIEGIDYNLEENQATFLKGTKEWQIKQQEDMFNAELEKMQEEQELNKRFDW